MRDYKHAHLELEVGKLGVESVKELEVFNGGYAAAIKNDVIDVYKVNLLANQHCAEDIDKAIAKNGNIMAYDKKTQAKLFTRAYEAIAEVYGNERIATVLCLNIEAREKMPSFENFSQGAKEWGELRQTDGLSISDNPLLLGSSYRPPLMVTNTDVLENFVEIAIQKEAQQQQREGRLNRSEEINPKKEAFLSAVLDKEPAIIPNTDDVVKLMAVKEIVASMTIPEMMKSLEQQLMNYDIEALQAVYPNAFKDKEPDRSVIAEKIVYEIKERSPIPTEEYTEVFNEVFNQKIVEPITGDDLSAFERDDGDYSHYDEFDGINQPPNPYEGDLTVTVGNLSVENVSDKYVENLKTMFIYNGVRTFSVDDETPGEVRFDIRSANLYGTTQQEADNMAVGYAKALFKSWNDSVDVPYVYNDIAAPATEIGNRTFEDIITDINSVFGESYNIEDTKNTVLMESYTGGWQLKETLSDDITKKAKGNYIKADELVAELVNWVSKVENITVHNQEEFDNIPQDFDGRIIIENTSETPIEVADKTVFIVTDDLHTENIHVNAFNSFVVAGEGVNTHVLDCTVYAEAYGSITAHGDSEIHSGHKTAVEAHDNTNVTATESNIVLYDKSTASATLCSIEANDYSRVFSYDNEIVLNDESTADGTFTKVTDNRTLEVQKEKEMMFDERGLREAKENSALDNKTMEYGFEVPKPVLPPSTAQENTGFDKFTEPLENGKEKMRENPPGFKKSLTLKERLEEKNKKAKEINAKENSTKKNKERDDISH
jgi:hypothetical protein